MSGLLDSRMGDMLKTVVDVEFGGVWGASSGTLTDPSLVDLLPRILTWTVFCTAGSEITRYG